MVAQLLPGQGAQQGDEHPVIVQKARGYDGAMDEPEIDALEHATLAAVPPTELLALDGWLVALDAGTVGRAHSAVPTRHTEVRHDLLGDIEHAYRARQLRPSFRVPRVPGCEPLQHDLGARGYTPRQPTLTLVGSVDALAAREPGHEVATCTQAGPGWAEVFLGTGFDPLDGASRLAILQRGRDTVFASAQRQGRIAAVGTACFSHGWCGIHGMRTAPDARGQGLASAILATFGRMARQRGLQRVFLQVEEGNTTARSLYGRAGLRTAWCSEYWRRG